MSSSISLLSAGADSEIHIYDIEEQPVNKKIWRIRSIARVAKYVQDALYWNNSTIDFLIRTRD
jgi:hypothetical protein